ncbi:DUF4344 domain-containing metallopeptidase [Streptomyces sp. BHT-5-2]|uniref:DUF4344 domain-containing metallopeptidase n=1 Tax=unclassified Streptomyces TaxID=2593676 RepID=UPI001C8E4DF9|nr:DUF4344 domain-containing metallopeptidase [Streptomyces sp. BHT-5-2]QZL05086.1 DUF4344 domain-containing metallopeptidase [Streptomyces sp. BHT-5-2]
MGRRTGNGTRALLTLALAAAVTGCTAGEDTADARDTAARRTHGKDSAGGFAVQYRTGDRAARATDYLRSRRILEKAADRLNDTVKVPHRIPFVVRSCGAPEPAYDPDTGAVDFCVEHVDEIRDRVAHAGRAAVPRGGADAHVAAVLEETAYHEGAHALIDRLKLHFTGREEDVADQFAAVMLIDQGGAGDAKALAAAADYALSAEESPIDETDLLDEHSLDGQRAANYACYVYGAHPARHEGLVGDGGQVTEDRAESCPEEWTQARNGWQQLLVGRLKHHV